MNYTNIKDLALSYSDRQNDVEILSNIDSFILMAEVKINRYLRIRDMSVRAIIATVADQEYYPLPSDFNGLRDIELHVGDSRSTYEYLNPEQMNEYHNVSSTLSGNYYTIVANQVQILPTVDAGNTLEIVYFQTVQNLSLTNNNWVSDNYPDLYLAGLMVEISSFVKNADGAQLWESRFDKAVSAMTEQDLSNRWSGPSLQVRVG